MAQRLYAIVADTVLDNGLVSFKFMIDSNAPYAEFRDMSRVFGVLTLTEKSDNYVDPFRLMQGRPGAIGSDGFRRWNLNVFESDRGFILGAGCDEDKSEEVGLQEALVRVPDCVLLTHHDAFEQFQTACQAVGVDLRSFTYDGMLATS